MTSTQKKILRYVTIRLKWKTGFKQVFCSREQRKKQVDWLPTNTDVITSQSHSLFACSHKQIREVENRLYGLKLSVVFLGFTMQICSKSEWGSTSTVLMFMLHRREQMTGNCTYLPRNTRPTHTVNIYSTPMTMSRFRIDPH